MFVVARVSPQISLNRRLPQTFQRAACLLAREINLFEPTDGQNVALGNRGSRLFNTALLALERISEGFEARSKAAPLHLKSVSTVPS